MACWLGMRAPAQRLDAATEKLCGSPADPLMQVALSVFNSEWSAVTLVSDDRQMYIANAKGTKVLRCAHPSPTSCLGCTPRACLT